MSTQNYNQATTLLTRGKQEAVAIGAGANNDTDIYCGGDSKLNVMVQMTGGAIGDITIAVRPYEADNLTVQPQPLAAIRNPANVATGGKVYAEAEFDVQGFEKVQLRITNNNAGAQTLDRASWRLS